MNSGRIAIIDYSNTGKNLPTDCYKNAKLITDKITNFFDPSALEEELHLSLDKEQFSTCICNIDHQEQNQDDKDALIKINVDAVNIISDYFAKRQIPIIFTSTYAVFDGLSPVPYSEDDITNPISEYGKSKLEAENIVLSASDNNIIIRLPWTYDVLSNQCCVSGFIISSLNEEEIIAFEDHIGNMFNMFDLGRVLLSITETLALGSNIRGIFHLSSKGFASRYEIFSEVLRTGRKLFGSVIKTKNIIRSSSIDEEIESQRNCCLSSKKFLETFRITIPDWRFSLFNATQKIVKRVSS